MKLLPLLLLLALLPACQTDRPLVVRQTSPPTSTTTVAQPTPPDDAWRPAWWIDKPTRSPTAASAAAFATDADLLTSRKKAVDAATADLARLLGSAPLSPVTQADTVRLPTGQYRTFVLLSVPTTAPGTP